MPRESRAPEIEPVGGRADDAATERVRTASPAETEALGAAIAARLRAGDVVLLHGDLGAGKTTLVRGAAVALGVGGRVTSPTFALAHRYDADGLRVAHLDLYRLAGLGEDDEELVLDELAGDVVAFVEWPGPVVGLLWDRVVLEVRLEHAGEDGRTATLTWRGAR